jgi:hypothetical protein
VAGLAAGGHPTGVGEDLLGRDRLTADHRQAAPQQLGLGPDHRTRLGQVKHVASEAHGERVAQIEQGVGDQQRAHPSVEQVAVGQGGEAVFEGGHRRGCGVGHHDGGYRADDVVQPRQRISPQ